MNYTYDLFLEAKANSLPSVRLKQTSVALHCSDTALVCIQFQDFTSFLLCLLNFISTDNIGPWCKIWNKITKLIPVLLPRVAVFIFFLYLDITFLCAKMSDG